MPSESGPGASGSFTDADERRVQGGLPGSVVVWGGEVTWREVADLRENLFDAMDTHLDGVQLDVRRVTVIDRTGIALLIGANHRSHSMRRALIVLDDDGPVTAALTAAHVVTEFTLARASDVPAQRTAGGSELGDGETVSAAERPPLLIPDRASTERPSADAEPPGNEVVGRQLSPMSRYLPQAVVIQEGNRHGALRRHTAISEGWETAMTGQIETETVDLSGPNAASGTSSGLTGCLWRPVGEGPWPGVVMLFEGFGLDAQMQSHAHRLARMGYLTLIPDLYAQGGPRRCLMATMRPLRSGTGRAFADIESARRYLLSHPDATGKVGSIGFCLGGGFAILAACRGFTASSVNYGPLPKDLQSALAGACPIVASYGARDPRNHGAANRLTHGLEREAIPHDVVEYPEAGHSFLNQGANGPRPLRPLMNLAGAGPHHPSAAHAWQRMNRSSRFT